MGNFCFFDESETEKGKCTRRNVEIDGEKRRKLELQTSDRAALTFLCENEEEVIMSGFYDS